MAEAALSAHRLGAEYYVSTSALTVTDARGMRRWRTHPYLVLSRLAADPVAYFGLPDERVVITGSDVRL